MTLQEANQSEKNRWNSYISSVFIANLKANKTNFAVRLHEIHKFCKDEIDPQAIDDVWKSLYENKNKELMDLFKGIVGC